MPGKVQDRRDCAICGHQAAWHALDLGTKIISQTQVICMLCTMNDETKVLNVCWTGLRG